MAKTGENIYKRKDGKWEGRYIKERVNGKIHYGYVFADSLEEAREKRRYAMEGLNLQGTDADTGEKAAGCFLTDVAGEWFDDLRPQLKESSRVKYRNILNSYILPEFGTHIISGITAVEVNSYVMRLLDTGGVKGQMMTLITRQRSSSQGRRTSAPYAGFRSLMKSTGSYQRYSDICSKRIFHHGYRREPYQPVEAKTGYMEYLIPVEINILPILPRYFIGICMVDIIKLAVFFPVYLHILWK